MRIILNEWGMGNDLPNFAAYVAANIKDQSNVEEELPAIVEKYNALVAKQGGNDHFELFKQAMSSPAKDAKAIVNHLVSVGTTEYAADIYAAKYAYKGIDLIFSIDLIISKLLYTSEEQIKKHQDLYLSEYRSVVRAVYATVKVMYENGYYDKVLEYCAVGNKLNPGDNLGFRFYAMEQFCGKMSRSEFEQSFPLTDEYSSRLFHICNMLANDLVEEANKYLLDFSEPELDILTAKKKVAMNQVYTMTCEGFEKDSIEEIRMLKHKHKLLDQFLIKSTLIEDRMFNK